jgi:hypothetical protein
MDKATVLAFSTEDGFTITNQLPERFESCLSLRLSHFAMADDARPALMLFCSLCSVAITNDGRDARLPLINLSDKNILTGEVISTANNLIFFKGFYGFPVALFDKYERIITIRERF